MYHLPGLQCHTSAAPNSSPGSLPVVKPPSGVLPPQRDIRRPRRPQLHCGGLSGGGNGRLRRRPPSPPSSSITSLGCGTAPPRRRLLMRKHRFGMSWHFTSQPSVNMICSVFQNMIKFKWQSVGYISNTIAMFHFQ